MTVAERIHNHLAVNFQSSMTNSQIAFDLGIPEPSVRRATYRLEGENKIYNTMGSSSNYLSWQIMGENE